ncbi:hypothetical protein ST201phi2-1p068 [Pseudomonas phage 201phi2-1]|uniref:Uncharacterized protein n=1 Tax=Pseudomonas phage 201phi2-1 TaxID=198110 RepID=B3FK43_BP201|nr:hypothetical protein ST201phi2-1p068 [Pseudomonas phage 201phi2-1]ABY62901.1 hypothetical protein 201phi2-1p068 [Pseudomonas phage 201phi2-1]
MNRQEQFKQLVEEWLELDLPYTCTSLDLYTSVRIERKADTVVFSSKRAGQVGELGMAQIKDGKVDGMVYVSSTPHLGLMLFGLEKSVEAN